MNIGHVQGGTNAGWRIVKQPVEWRCPEGRSNLGYSCTCGCGARRPKPKRKR